MDTNPDHLKSPEDLAAERRAEARLLRRRLAIAFGALFLIAGAMMFFVSRDIDRPDDAHLIVSGIDHPEAQARFLALGINRDFWPPPLDGRPSRTFRLMERGSVAWDVEVGDRTLEKASALLELFNSIAKAESLQCPPASSENYHPVRRSWMAFERSVAARRFQARHLAKTGSHAALLVSARELLYVESLLLAEPASVETWHQASRLRRKSESLLLEFLWAETGADELRAGLEFLESTPPRGDLLPSGLRRSYTEFTTQVTLPSAVNEARAFPGLRWYYFQTNRTLELLVAEADAALVALEKPYHQRAFRHEALPELSTSVLAYVRPNQYGKIHARLDPLGARLQSATLAHHEVAHGALRLLYARKIFETEQGRPLENLTDLVPAYLDTLPIDPFDGAQLRFDLRPGGGWAYSVGEDRRDAGGSVGRGPRSLNKNEPSYSFTPPPDPESK